MPGHPEGESPQGGSLQSGHRPRHLIDILTDPHLSTREIEAEAGITLNPGQGEVRLQDSGQIVPISSEISNPGTDLVGGGISGTNLNIQQLTALRGSAGNPESAARIDQEIARLERGSAQRAVRVARSRKSQSQTRAVNQLVFSGRKKARGSSVAIPRAGALLGGDDRNRLLL